MLGKIQQIYDASIFFLCKLTRRKQEVKNFQYVKKKIKIMKEKNAVCCKEHGNL